MSDDGDDGLPPVGEEWLSEEPWEDDSLAQFEEDADHLDAQIRAQEKRNKLNFTRAVGWIVVRFIFFAGGLLAAGIAVLAYHYMTPWCFLSEAELHKLQSIIFSGALGAMVSALARQYGSKD